MPSVDTLQELDGFSRVCFDYWVNLNISGEIVYGKYVLFAIKIEEISSNNRTTSLGKWRTLHRLNAGTSSLGTLWTCLNHSVNF